MDLVAQMVEGEHPVKEHQHAIGDIEVIRGVFANALEAPHNVISAISNGARSERRQAFEFGGAMLLQELFYNFENISRAAFEFAATFDGDLFAARFQPQKRAHAKKCVASNFFPAFDGLEQESVSLAISYGKEGGDWSQQVGGDRFHHRNQRGSARQASEFFVVRTDHLDSAQSFKTRMFTTRSAIA